MNLDEKYLAICYLANVCGYLGKPVPIFSAAGEIMMIKSTDEQIADCLSQDFGRKGYDFDVWIDKGDQCIYIAEAEREECVAEAGREELARTPFSAALPQGKA